MESFTIKPATYDDLKPYANSEPLVTKVTSFENLQ